MLNNNQIKELKNNGFVVIQYLDINSDDASDFQEEINIFNNKHYTKDNLSSGSAYPSDSSETRTSNAYLVSEAAEQGVIPHISVNVIDQVNIMCLHRDWTTFLGQMNRSTSYFSPKGEVSLVNMQEYRGQSTAVCPHQDGMYFKMFNKEDGTFSITEALIAEYVGVLVLTNEGLSGTILREVDTGIEFHPTVEEGELIIFDNVRFTHEVPMLTRKRSMVGIRNWTNNPYHYTQERGNNKIKNTVGEFFHGYIEKVTSKKAEDLFLRDGKPYDSAPF